jgi:uncharacterized membrane protein YkoI
MKTFAALTCAVLLSYMLPVWAGVNRDDAASIVQKASGGRVLSVERAEHKGTEVWRVKVLTPQGEVKVMLIDAASGRPI